MVSPDLHLGSFLTRNSDIGRFSLQAKQTRIPLTMGVGLRLGVSGFFVVRFAAFCCLSRWSFA
jgi:hypothetical protein